MIFDAWFQAVADWWVSLWAGFQLPAVPAVVASGPTYIASTVDTAQQLCSWVALDLFLPVASVGVGAWAVGLALRVALMVLSAVTPGGIV